ncbi:MAG: AMIN domain-containing protein, partial [Terriglobales bacterium]
MSRKPMLGILLSLVVLGTMAAAAVSQLTEVSAAAQGGATIVTIRANGAFTHTEYRPADSLLLVDLSGVSADRMDGKTHSLQVPGVTAYRVVGFKGSNGAEVARVELTLAPGAGVNVSEGTNELRVRLTGFQGESAAAEKASPAPAPTPAAAAPLARSVTIRDLQVANAPDGLTIKIVATGPMTPKTMKLSAPERLVIDLPNAVPASGKREVAVNSAEVRAVRMAKFQADPPVTRVVVDLVSKQDFDLVNSGNRVTLKLRQAGAATAPATPPAPAPKAPEKAVAAAADESAATANAKDFVFVEPAYQAKPAAEVPAAEA